MASFFSMNWRSVQPHSTFVQQSTASDVSNDDQIALHTLKHTAKSMLEDAIPSLPDDDPFRCLLDDSNSLQHHILLRFLHFNELNVPKAQRQLLATLKWRAHTRICAVDLAVIRGSPSGIPLSRLSPTTENGDALFFAAAELYDKSAVRRAVQRLGVARMFEHILYDRDGPRTKRGTVVVDFTGFGAKHIDLNGLRIGVTTYMSHYPEVFDTIFLANYPRLLYGVWRAIAPLLDTRTARRVVWVDEKEQLREALMERFPEKQIPSWLGGEAEELPVRFLNGQEISAELLAQRFA